MAQQTLIARTTSAVTAKTIVHAPGSPHVFLSADGLAGAEECDVFIMAGNTWVVMMEGGSAVKLTATAPSVRLYGGPTYAVTKDATAGACGVYFDV